MNIENLKVASRGIVGDDFIMNLDCGAKVKATNAVVLAGLNQEYMEVGMWGVNSLVHRLPVNMTINITVEFQKCDVTNSKLLDDRGEENR